VRECGLTSHESGERSLELPVNREGAANEPDRAGAGAELVERPLPGGDHLGLVAQAQVVVRGKDHHLAASLHPGSCGLRRFEVVEPLVHAVAPELLQLGLEPGCERHAISRMILPASPARIAASASSTWASGNWCVMTGRGSSRPAVR